MSSTPQKGHEPDSFSSIISTFFIVFMSNSRNLPIFRLILIAAILFFSHASVSYSLGGKWVSGYVAGKGLVLGPNKKPIWVEYNADGTIGSEIGEAQGDPLGEARVLSANVCRGWISQFNNARSGKQNSTTVVGKDSYNATSFECKAGQSETGPIWGTASKPALRPDSNSVIVTKKEFLTNCASGLLVFESPLNLTSGVPNINDTAQSVLISKKGDILKVSDKNIGYKSAFYGKENGEVTNTGLTSLYGYKPGTDKLWGPIEGAKVEVMADSPTTTEPSGRYAASLSYISTCPGYSWSYDLNIYATLRYTQFNPRSKNSSGIFMVGRPFYYYCSEMAQSMLAIPNFNAQMAGMAMMSMENQINKYWYPGNDIPVDVANLSGLALMSNRTMGNPENPVAKLPIGRTLYSYQNHNQAPSDPRPGSHEIPVDVDFMDRGLLQSISKTDLLDTDIYLYRESNDQAITYQQGLIPYEISNDENTDINYRIFMRGPASFVFMKQKQLIPWQKANNVNPELHGASADDIRVGENIKVVLVNRKTGYMGTGTANLGAAGGRVGDLISFIASTIELRPPNLKIWAEREPDVSKWTDNRDNPDSSRYNRPYVIGSQGAGLTNDSKIIIYTDWIDQDGTPLPSSLPGFTGRLAKVVKADGGSELNEISNFEIKPGRKMQVLRLSEDQDNTHFYVHVSGQPTDRNPDFSGSAADSGPLASRPANYVPVRVPVYDKASSPNDPREPGIYRYIYRPEYTFSLYRAVLPVKPPMPAGPGKPEITETTPEDRPLSGSDANQSPENNREALEAVLGAYGLNYMLTTDKAAPLPILDSAPGSLVFGNGSDSETTAVIDSNGRIVIGSAQQTLSALKPEDYFALKLYSNGDEGNVLWQIETPVISNIELQDEHEKKVLNAPMGVSVFAKATTHPEKREVLWTVEEHQDGVSAMINAYTGSIYVLENSKSGWIKLRATDKQRPNVFKEVIIYVGCFSCSSGTCGNQPGVSFVELSGVNLKLCAGPAPEKDGKGFLGELYIRSKIMAPELGTTRALGFSTMYEEAAAVYDKTGAVRQVVTPKSFMDIVTLNASSYEVRVYENTAKGAWNGNEYKISNSSTPSSVWKIEYKDFSLSLSSSTETWLYTYNKEKNEWTLVKTDGSKEKIIETLNSNGERTVRRETIGKTTRRAGKADVGNPEELSNVTEIVYKKIDGFERIIKETTDPDGARITTNTEYDTVEGASGLGKPKKIVNQDGSWTRYEYDSLGRKTKEIRPYLSAGSEAGPDSSVVSEYDYTPLDGDSNLEKDKESPRTITEKTLGVVTSKSYHVYVLTPDGYKKEITERCSGGTPPGSPLPPGEGQGEGIKPFGDPSNQKTVNIYYPATASRLERGRLKSSESSDGRVTTYSYAYGKFTKGSNPASSKFIPGTGSDIQETVVTGTKTFPDGVSGKTTMEVRVTDSLGYALMEETKVFSGTGYERISCKTHTYDDLGREISTISSDGIKTSKTWSCCGLDTETSAEGIVTKYTLDALKRISSKETEGLSGSVRTSYVYDAAGRKVSETVTAGDISMVSSTKYDGAGRVVSSKDASGLEVIYAYSADGRTTTVTRPGGATEITERYPDGRTKSVTGTGATAQYFEYGVEAGGSSWTISRIGSPDSPMYEKTVSDISGRTIRTEKPGAKGVEVTKNYYDSNGRLVKTETPGMASTLYVYNDLGETVRSGLDVDGNGILEPASQDRITESETQFKKIGSDWWQESVSRIYAEDNSATPKNTGLSRSRLTGLGAANLTAESESFDINGNKSSSKTFTDAAGKTVTNQVNAAGWAQPSTTVSRFGLAVSSKDQAGIEVLFEYDALGRKIKTTDPRTGASVTHFDSKGRVDYVADAAGFKTEFGYDDATGRKVWEKNASGKFTRYSYDVKGRMTRTWGDSVYPVAYSYDDTGRMVSMTTYRAEPSSGAGWNGETFPENATGDTTKWHYGPATGLLLSKEYADGTKTEYKYAEAGRLDTRTWARKITGSPDAGDVSTKYSYDPATASLSKIDYSDETTDITFSYDRIGRQKSITDAVGTRTFAYNDSLQLWRESIEGLTPATITRLYEVDGVKGRPKGFAIEKSGVANLPLPQGEGRGEGRYEISYGYDPSGRIKTLSWNAGGKADSATYEYLENSHLLSGMKTGSGFATSYTYEDHRNVKTAVSNSFGNTAVSTYTYEYDELGRRKSVKNTGPAFTNANFNIYGYNDRSEVTASNSFTGEDLANKNNPLADRGRAYNYDPIGNRKNVTEAANNFSYSANSLNQYESISGGANSETPAYDLDGNMTVAKGMVYTYNAENRLIEATPQNLQQGSVKSTYIYDYMGRRTRKTLYTYSSGSWEKQKDISFIYDGWNMVKESEKAADSSPEVPVYYVWGLDLSQSMQGAGGVGGLITSVKSGNEYLYTYDGNGNVGQMLKASDGSIAARYEYDPFGKTLFSEGPMASENPYRFSTKYQDDETGLYYYGYRYYDVEMGRWINRDPIGEWGGLNIYEIVQNDLIDLYDLIGLTDPEFGAALSFGLGWDSITKKPTYSVTISGSASQGLCDNLKVKADVNYRLYNSGLGASIIKTGKEISSDLSVSLSATIGEGQGNSTPSYTLNYNTKSVINDNYRNSITWGQAWNYNSNVGKTNDGFIGLKANNLYGHYNNDVDEFPTYGGSTDYAWTAGFIMGVYVGGGKRAEIGFQDFTGKYIDRSLTEQIKGMTHYRQLRDQKGLNRADWFLRFGEGNNSITATVGSPEWLNGQHIIHDNRKPRIPRFQYLTEDDLNLSFSVEGEVKAN